MKTFGSAMRNSLFPKAISHLYLHRTGRDECSFQDPSLTYATQHSNTPACAKCIKIQRRGAGREDEERSSLTAKLHSEQEIESRTPAALR